MRSAAIILLSAVLAGTAGCGLMAPRGDEGFANLDSLGPLDVDRVMTLSIGPTLLHFAARYMDDDPEMQALLRGLDGVRVRIYEIDGDPQRVAERIEAMSLKLSRQDWEPVALVQEDGEESHMLVKASEQGIRGLTVITSDGEEAVIVNVMGDLKPEFFSDTMAALDVDVPAVHVADAKAQSMQDPPNLESAPAAPGPVGS